MLDDSTSGVWLLRALADVSPLTVVTNSLLVARELERRDHVRLVVAGGEYQAWAESVMGATTVATIERMQADFCVLSASGHARGQLLHPYSDVASVKSAMIAASSTRILMIDHTKFRRRALYAFAHLSDFDIVVVDAETSEADRELVRDQGVRLLVAGEGTGD